MIGRNKFDEILKIQIIPDRQFCLREKIINFIESDQKDGSM